MVLEDYKKNIQEFADKFDLIFDQAGECGFGRHCVGIRKDNFWLNYNPIHMGTYEEIEEFYDERLNKILPEDAYHKHPCVAVLGRNEEAIRQLSEWIDKLKELDVTVEKYKTGATGLQAMVSGTHNFTLKCNKK